MHHERTEERRKLVKGSKEESSRNIHEKWRKIIGSALSDNHESRDHSKSLSKDIEAPKETFNERAVDVPETMVEMQKLDKNQLKVNRPTSELSFQSINEISSIGEPNPDERGSLCNRLINENNAQKTIVHQPENIPEEVDDLRKKPPKIWISKSASMDDDLD